jgi:hypothetical protein
LAAWRGIEGSPVHNPYPQLNVGLAIRDLV